MLNKTKGIVFHTVKYNESSMIVKIFTEKFGLKSFIVNRPKSRKSGINTNILQPLAILDLDIYNKENKTLQRIKEMAIVTPFHSLYSNPIKTSLALFLSELLYRTIKEEEQNLGLFSFIVNAIEILEIREHDLANFHLVFIIKFSKFLGLYPHNNYNENDFFDLIEGRFIAKEPMHPHILLPIMAKEFSKLISVSFENMAEVRFNREDRFELLDKLITYIRLHLVTVGEFKSHIILRTTLE